MTTQREFLKTAGPLAGFLAMAAGPGVLAMTGVLPTPHDDYRPTGYLDTDTPGASDVDFVTLDGRRLERVVRLDDVEGWVEYLGNVDAANDRIRTFHEAGTVRVHWRRS